jgi:hypothetical protein
MSRFDTQSASSLRSRDTCKKLLTNFKRVHFRVKLAQNMRIIRYPKPHCSLGQTLAARSQTRAANRLARSRIATVGLDKLASRRHIRWSHASQFFDRHTKFLPGTWILVRMDYALAYLVSDITGRIRHRMSFPHSAIVQRGAFPSPWPG